MIATSSSTLGRGIAKRATAAVRQRATAHEKQHYQRTLATTIDNGRFGLGSIRDHDDDDDERSRVRSKNHFVLCLAPNTIALQPRASDSEVSRRAYHTTSSVERAPAIIMGLATVSALGFAGSSAIKSFNEWKDSQPTKEEMEEMRKQEEKEQAKMKAQEAQQQQQQAKEEKADSDRPRTNIFREWFDVGTKYYEGGFEDTMTKREAALILGVRESSSPARVKDAHRKLLILNHPDTGGSTYLAGKLNEAKELLLKGRSQKKK